MFATTAYKQSSLGLLATDVLVLPIHDLNPRLPDLGRVDN